MQADHFERSVKVTPGGVHSPVRSFKGLDQEPVFFKSAQGATLKDVHGKEYIDYCQSFGPLILGHRDEEVQEELIRAISDVWTLGACEPYSLELAEWITKRIPFVEQIRFVNSGTEATMSALRIARAKTGRDLILKFEGCYHGHHDSLLVQTGSGLAGASASSSAGVSASTANQTLVCPLDDEEAVGKIFSERGTDIAAVILEPLPANFGLLEPRKEWTRFVCDTARKNGALVIFDEVISGFRVDLSGMAGILDIAPDLVAYGKVIGGGFPVGAYAGKKELMEQVSPRGNVYQAGTLSANPVAMRAGLATLKKIERERTIEVLANRGSTFAKTFNSRLRNSDLEMASFGSLFWIHPRATKPIRRVSDIPSNLAKRFKPFFLSLLNNGVYLSPNAYEVGFLSAAHTEGQLEETLSFMEKACDSV